MLCFYLKGVGKNVDTIGSNDTDIDKENFNGTIKKLFLLFFYFFLFSLKLKKNQLKKSQESLKNVDGNDTKIATLKIKSISGENAFLVKMKYTDTIQNLKDHIKTQK